MKVLLFKFIGGIAAFVKAHVFVSIATAVAIVIIGVGTPVLVSVLGNKNEKTIEELPITEEITDLEENENEEIDKTDNLTEDVYSNVEDGAEGNSSNITAPENQTKPNNSGKPVSSNQNSNANVPSTSNKPEIKNKLQTLNYQYYSNMIDGVMLVKNDSNKIGMIDSSGKLLVDYKYSSGLISDGGYVVFEKRYVYDKTGKLVFEDENSTIEHCGNGIVLLSESGEWKMEGHKSWTNKKVYKKIDGTVVYTVFGSSKCGQFNKQGYAWLIKAGCDCCLDRTVEIINLKGEVVNSRGSWHMVVGENTWIIGEDGFVLTDDMVSYGGTRYMNMETIKEDIYSSIWKGQELFLLLENIKNKDVVFNVSYNDNGYPCFSVNSLAVISFDNNHYLFDIKKNEIVTEYKNISITDSKFILVKNSRGKWGYIDKNGKEYKYYDDATNFDDG